MAFSDQQLREVFHLIFLEQLTRLSDRKLYVIKGGVNLRFFFQSPRYSEDMDLDVVGGSVETLKKNGFKILESEPFQRTLATYGITRVLLNDPTKAKQTETTQRFKVRLVNQAGEELPTKVEFSRRDQKEAWLDEAINPEIARTYKRQSFLFQHYSGELAAAQKIRALAGRPETQARDVFDLYHLYLGGFWTDRVQPGSAQTKSKACENAISISYDQYRDQVESYLATDSLPQFGGKKTWQTMQDFVVGRLS